MEPRPTPGRARPPRDSARARRHCTKTAASSRLTVRASCIPDRWSTLRGVTTSSLAGGAHGGCGGWRRRRAVHVQQEEDRLVCQKRHCRPGWRGTAYCPVRIASSLLSPQTTLRWPFAVYSTSWWMDGSETPGCGLSRTGARMPRTSTIWRTRPTGAPCAAIRVSICGTAWSHQPIASTSLRR